MLAVLGAILWWPGAQHPDDATATPEGAVFQGVAASEIDRIRIETTDAGPAELERRDGHWRLTAPVDFPADEVAADGLASALARLDSDAVYSEIEPLAAYGLDGEPVVTFSAGGASRSLRVGHGAAVGGGTYVTDESGERVWVVPSWRAQVFEKTLAALRDAAVVAFESDAVGALEVAWPGAGVALARKDGVWRLTEPLQASAREATVADLLSDLRFLRATGYADEHRAAAERALASPAYTVRLWIEGAAEPVEVALAPGEDEASWWARGPTGNLYAVAASDVSAWPRTVAAFRFRELARFVPAEAERVEIRFGATADPVVVVRDADRDWTPAPGSEAFAAAAPARLLATLSRLEAIDIAAEALGEAERAGLGLAPPAARVRVLGAEDAVLADVSFGVARADGAVAAQRADVETAYWVDASVSQDVPISAAAFAESFRAVDAADAEPGDAAPAASD